MNRKPLPDNQSRELADRTVNIHNDLVAASHGLKTLAEQRVVKSCVAMIDSVRPDRGRYVFVLTAQDYATTFGLDPNTAYEQLKAVSLSLLDRVIVREEKTAKRTKVHRDHWVTGCTYEDGAGYVELRFSHEATPYLTALKGNHTSYLLRQAASLRSIYSWRLLEMLTQFKNTGWKQISVEEFAKAMDVPPSLTNDFAQLRRRVIEPAVKELTEKDGWNIKWEPIAVARKITALRFKFKRKAQQELPLTDNISNDQTLREQLEKNGQLRIDQQT
jgi:plasmid replication initiation protein